MSVLSSSSSSSAATTKRILVVSSKVQTDVTKYLLHKGESVILVPYDFDTLQSFDELLELIHAKVVSQPRLETIDSVGLMFHTHTYYTMKLFAKDPQRSTVPGVGHVADYRDFVTFAKTLQTFYDITELDLITCHTLANANDNLLLTIMEQNEMPCVNASVNTDVGSPPGGRWMLEMYGVELIGRYFNGRINGSGIELGTTTTTTTGGITISSTTNVGAFNVAQIAQITQAQMQALTPTQVGQFTATQFLASGSVTQATLNTVFQYLLPTQVSGLSIAFFNGLTTNQYDKTMTLQYIFYLTLNQLNLSNSTFINNIGLFYDKISAVNIATNPQYIIYINNTENGLGVSNEEWAIYIPLMPPIFMSYFKPNDLVSFALTSSTTSSGTAFTGINILATNASQLTFDQLQALNNARTSPPSGMRLPTNFTNDFITVLSSVFSNNSNTTTAFLIALNNSNNFESLFQLLITNNVNVAMKCLNGTSSPVPFSDTQITTYLSNYLPSLTTFIKNLSVTQLCAQQSLWKTFNIDNMQNFTYDHIAYIFNNSQTAFLGSYIFDINLYLNLSVLLTDSNVTTAFSSTTNIATIPLISLLTIITQQSNAKVKAKLSNLTADQCKMFTPDQVGVIALVPAQLNLLAKKINNDISKPLTLSPTSYPSPIEFVAMTPDQIRTTLIANKTATTANGVTTYAFSSPLPSPCILNLTSALKQCVKFLNAAQVAQIESSYEINNVTQYVESGLSYLLYNKLLTQTQIGYLTSSQIMDIIALQNTAFDEYYIPFISTTAIGDPTNGISAVWNLNKAKYFCKYALYIQSLYPGSSSSTPLYIPNTTSNDDLPVTTSMLFPSTMAMFKGVHMTAFTSTQIKAMDQQQFMAMNDNIAFLSPEQIRQLDANKVALLSTNLTVGTAQNVYNTKNVITTQYFPTGSSVQWAVHVNQIALFTTTQIPEFTTDVIKAFTPSQIACFTTGANDSDGNPTIRQIQAFTTSQIADFTTDQIGAFTLSQIQAMLPSQIAALTNAQFKILVGTKGALVTSLGSLSLQQLAAINTTTIDITLANFGSSPDTYHTHALNNFSPTATYLTVSSVWNNYSTKLTTTGSSNNEMFFNQINAIYSKFKETSSSNVIFQSLSMSNDILSSFSEKIAAINACYARADNIMDTIKKGKTELMVGHWYDLIQGGGTKTYKTYCDNKYFQQFFNALQPVNDMTNNLVQTYQSRDTQLFFNRLINIISTIYKVSDISKIPAVPEPTNWNYLTKYANTTNTSEFDALFTTGGYKVADFTALIDVKETVRIMSIPASSYATTVNKPDGTTVKFMEYIVSWVDSNMSTSLEKIVAKLTEKNIYIDLYNVKLFVFRIGYYQLEVNIVNAIKNIVNIYNPSTDLKSDLLNVRATVNTSTINNKGITYAPGNWCTHDKGVPPTANTYYNWYLSRLCYQGELYGPVGTSIHF